MRSLWRRAPRALASLVALALAASALLFPLPVHADEFDSCRATKVVDGDTLYVECDGREHHVRLLRVDTPERNEPGYEEARDALARAVEKRRLRLEFEEPGTPSYGNYGRLLAYVFAQAGSTETFVNAELVRGGYSRFWTKYGRGRYASVFEAAEAAAPTDAPRATRRRELLDSGSEFENERGASCCRVCRNSQPCGDSCISRSKTCRKGSGCACAAVEGE